MERRRCEPKRFFLGTLHILGGTPPRAQGGHARPARSALAPDADGETNVRHGFERPVEHRGALPAHRGPGDRPADAGARLYRLLENQPRSRVAHLLEESEPELALGQVGCAHADGHWQLDLAATAQAHVRQSLEGVREEWHRLAIALAPEWHRVMRAVELDGVARRDGKVGELRAVHVHRAEPRRALTHTHDLRFHGGLTPREAQRDTNPRAGVEPECRPEREPHRIEVLCHRGTRRLRPRTHDRDLEPQTLDEAIVVALLP